MVRKIKERAPKKRLIPQTPVGKPYSALKYVMPLEKGETVYIKGEPFMVKRIMKKDVILRSIKTERKIR